MLRAHTIALVLLTVVLAGCGDGVDESPTRQTAAQLLKREAPEGPYTETSCVELAQARYFRCEATKGSTTSYFDAIVSKDGKAISIAQR